MRERTFICKGDNSNRKFRVVRDIYYQDIIDLDKNLMFTDIFYEMQYKLQVKILWFWVTIKTNQSYKEKDADYLYKITVCDFNRLVDWYIPYIKIPIKDYANNLPNEKWKVLEENNIYSISNLGRIKNNNTNILLHPVIYNKGYYRITIRIKGHKTTLFIHRLVAKYFIENNNGYNTVDHKDGNKLNNVYTNLRWCSIKENTNNPNTKDNIRKGILSSNKGNKNAVLLLDDNRNVVKEFRSAKEAAKYFNISSSYMSNYLNNKTLYNRQGNPYKIKNIKGHTLIYK